MRDTGGNMPQALKSSTPIEDRSVTIYRIDQQYRTIRTLFKTIGVVAGLYCLALAIAPFAGRETAVSLAMNFLADVKFALTVTLAGAATAWAVVERKLRERKTQYLQDRIKQLETNIDNNRSSSGLTRTGKTNPRDRRP